MTRELTFSFGRYRLVPGQRTLMKGDKPVRLGSRSFDILTALVERAGNVIPNAELIAHVWPNVVVEPSTIRVHVAGLRKALHDGQDGNRFIVNVPLQGYCFVAEVERQGDASTSPPSPHLNAAQESAVDRSAVTPLPVLLTRLVGRDELISDVVRELPNHRCVTLVGPGGIGKTSVALAVAQSLDPEFVENTVFVGLASLADESLVPSALSSALGIPSLARDPVQGLVAYLRQRRVLVILDNCEHVIGAVAEMAEALLSGAAGLHLLVTSREPLRIQGEWVQRLRSLSVPPTITGISAAQAKSYASVQLFLERVSSAMDMADIADADAQAVCDICRALDGIPLALELAAAGVEKLGLRGVASQLGHKMTLLTRGRRTALPRHQTLKAALDWSHALLSAEERTMFRRLSVFRGRFNLADALSVCSNPAERGDELDGEILADLVSKSLVASDVGGDSVQYWLLETTREFAAGQLEEAGESGQTYKRYAQHMVDWAGLSEKRRESQPHSTWISESAHRIDDVRAALNWTFSERGDLAMACTLAAASAPLWFALSRMSEYQGVSDQAMAALARGFQVDAACEVALHEARGHTLWHLQGISPEAKSAFQSALDVAERTGSTPARSRALWGLWLICNSSGEYKQAADIARQFGVLTEGSSDPGVALTYRRMMVLSLHYNGDHAGAQGHAERILKTPLATNASARHSGFHFDQRVSAMTSLARILWIRGHSERAMEYGRQAVERAAEIDHALSLCYALTVGSIPVAMWNGEWKLAEQYTALLRQRADELSLVFWQAWCEGYELILERRHGRSEETLDALQNPATGDTLRDTLCTLDEGVADDETLYRRGDGSGGWSTPELLRIRGERLVASGSNDGEAEKLFVQGLELAQAHGALAWQVRCALSLAQLRHSRSRTKKSLSVIEAAVSLFDSASKSPDYLRASSWLSKLA